MRRKRKEALTGYLLAAPVLLGTLVFFAIPFCITFRYSFTFGVGGAKFVGLDNYGKVLSSKAFQLAAANTFRFLGVGIPLMLILSFSIALMLKKKFAGNALLRSVLLLPLVMPIASVVMVVQIFFNEGGILNHLLKEMGREAVDWLDSGAAFPILVGMYLWKNLGYHVVLMLSGLNMIPTELYQSASLEGAGFRQKLRFITLPMMVPTLFFTFVVSIIYSFKVYREAFLLGGEHPHDSIYLLQHFLNNNFNNLNYQRLSVAAILLFLVIFALVAAFYAAQYRKGRRDEG